MWEKFVPFWTIQTDIVSHAGLIIIFIKFFLFLGERNSQPTHLGTILGFRLKMPLLVSEQGLCFVIALVLWFHPPWLPSPLPIPSSSKYLSSCCLPDRPPRCLCWYLVSNHFVGICSFIVVGASVHLPWLSAPKPLRLRRGEHGPFGIVGLGSVDWARLFFLGWKSLMLFVEKYFSLQKICWYRISPWRQEWARAAADGPGAVSECYQPVISACASVLYSVS